VVAGAGPAGSIAALVLARAGARVALVDKASFPRDKACGDLVGPRGVAVLEALGLAVPGALPVADMVVVGPTGRRVSLPCHPGRDYPGLALAVPRRRLDDHLRRAALDAGAHERVARVAEPVLDGSGAVTGVVLSSGESLPADFVIGADGATSRVADMAGLVQPERVLYGFAVRTYCEDRIDAPHILLRDVGPWRGLPGYGWAFPGPGPANAGIGLGLRSDRRRAAEATRALPGFLEDLRRLGLLATGGEPASLGGWLKMGMVGTVPARGRVLLVGDAAGLVNPLQGEGISQAMASGAAAATAVLRAPATAAASYRRALADQRLPYMAVAASVHAGMLGRPRVIAAAGRALTAPGVGRAIAGVWSLSWNDLVAGASPRPAAVASAALLEAARLATARTGPAQWIRTAVAPRDEEVPSVASASCPPGPPGPPQTAPRSLPTP